MCSDVKFLGHVKMTETYLLIIGCWILVSIKGIGCQSTTGLQSSSTESSPIPTPLPTPTPTPIPTPTPTRTPLNTRTTEDTTTGIAAHSTYSTYTQQTSSTEYETDMSTRENGTLTTVFTETPLVPAQNTTYMPSVSPTTLITTVISTIFSTTLTPTTTTTTTASTTAATTTAAANGSDTSIYLIIGFIIIAMLSIVLAVLLYLIFRSKPCTCPPSWLPFLESGDQPQEENGTVPLQTTTLNPTNPDIIPVPPVRKKTINEETIGDQSKVLSSKVNLENLQKYIHGLKTHAGSGFKKEYSHIPKRYEKPKFAEHSALVTKNKFKDILPYDSTRVVLNASENDSHSNYINASWVKGYETEDLFIASQGPWYTTLEDFWRMIWEYNVAIVVMVTQYVEKGVRKVEQYIPERVNRSEVHGDITVTLVKEDIRADFTTRVLNVTSGEDKRVIRQFHFTAWPDHGVPSHGASLANFHKQVKNHMAPEQPVVVHCSAGVGRTGTYIALDQLLQQGEKTGYVDILGCVQHMRKHRSHMVQTMSQYVFLYETLLEAFAVGNTTIACNAYVKEYQRLKRYSRVSTKPRIRSQFELLQVISEETDKDVYSHALKKENKKKIRNTDIIPNNNRRVLLKTISKDENDFINAVSVDGYKKTDAFIATQHPLEETVRDFWVMVKDYDCGAVVLISDEQIGSFLPTDEADAVFDNVTVQRSLSVENKGFVVHDLRVERVKEEGDSNPEVDGEPVEANTRVFDVKVDGDSLDFDMLVEVYQGVQKWQQRNDQRPVLVVCPDGAKYCGKFIAASCLFDMINATQEFDVFYIVKLIRMSCKHFISKNMDYEELYDIIGKYIESFSDYSNFK